MAASLTGGFTAKSYTIQQGDHLSGIAEQFGFANHETIWNDPNNATLKTKRGNAHVLYPGDTLFIPDQRKKTVAVPTTKVHRFQITAKPLELRIVLKDFDNQPIAGAQCVLEIDGASYNLTSDKTGLVRTRIPKTAKNGILRVPSLDLEIPCQVGHLDPIEEDSGWRARLTHLGYLQATADDNAKDRLRPAIEEFQCDYKLKVTGELDAATRAKLKEAHGA